MEITTTMAKLKLGAQPQTIKRCECVFDLLAVQFCHQYEL